MTDPISGGIGKASQQMMQEMQSHMNKAQEQTGAAGKAGFNDHMATNGTHPSMDVQKVQEAHKAVETTKAVDVLRTAQANKVNGVDKSLGVKQVDAAAKPKESGLKSILNQVVEGQNKLDQIIKMATSGKTYSNQDLLAIQASVYKFSQELDMTSKVVEKATSGVKQTMQTQV